MSYKLEQSIVPPPGTDTIVACDFEISESSSKLPAFFPRKTKCTPAVNTKRHFKISFPRENEAIKHYLVEFKVQCLKVFCYHGNKSCFCIQFLEQLLKFLVNFTLLKYVKFQRNYGFLITKELIFGFQILDLKDHFSASLTD